MKRIIVSLLTTVVASVAQADLVVGFNASNTTTIVNFGVSQDLTEDNTSGNGPIWVAYNENGSQSAGINIWNGAGLRVRNQADGGQGTALFGFDLGGSYNFETGVNDDIVMRLSANNDRIDTSGSGVRAALKNSGTWYVSEEVLETSGPAQTFDALSLNWFALGGDTSAQIVNVSGSAVNASTFTDITMAGAWIEVLGVADSGGNPNSNYGVNLLQINAVVIPEPSTMGLLGLGALVSIFGRRLRRR